MKPPYIFRTVKDLTSGETKLFTYGRGGQIDKAMQHIDNLDPADNNRISCFQDASVEIRNDRGNYSATIKKQHEI